MTLMQRTDFNSRVRLVASWRGLSMNWERPAVGGGWYPDNSITMAWPWRRLR